MRYFLLLLFFLETGCSSEPKAGTRFGQIAKMRWLVGRWEVTQPLSETYVQEPPPVVQSWTLENDSVLVATSWLFRGGDSVLGESVRLEERSGHLEYNVTAPGQNGDTSVTFLRSGSDSTAPFISEAREFPQSVRYRPITRDSAVMEVAGNTAQGYHRRHFQMKRL